jgi:hypothetical protein
MKKYLMTGIAAVALCAAFTSCSKSDLYDEGRIEQEKALSITQKYEAAFEKAFGKVGSNVDWGFSSKAATRAAQPNSNQWGTHDDNDKYLDWPKPADITDDERAAVLAVFNQKGKESYTDLLNLTDFFVQQVYCGPNGVKMNQLACWDPEGHNQTIYGDPSHNYQEYTIFTHDDEVNNFNGGKYDNNALQGCMLMWNSSTSQWSFKTSQSGGERIYDHWRMEYIPGYGYYVGLDHEAWRQAPANANEEDKRDYIYNDWIIKIVPGKGFTPPVTVYPRVIAEDLSASEAGDFDFNDVIFDVISYNSSTDKTTLRLIACGGTLPLTVGGVDVHALYGDTEPGADGKLKMWNTGYNSHDPIDFEVDGDFSTPEKLLNLKIMVKKEGVSEPMELTATRGKAACKILVDSTFPYIAERQSIASATVNFTNYVSGEFQDDFWWKQTK